MSFDHDNVASAVFSQPPVGTVGLSEADARHGGRKITIYRSVFRPMKTTFYGGEERMLMKLVVDTDQRPRARLPYRRARRAGDDPDGRDRRSSWASPSSSGTRPAPSTRPRPRNW